CRSESPAGWPLTVADAPSWLRGGGSFPKIHTRVLVGIESLARGRTSAGKLEMGGGAPARAAWSAGMANTTRTRRDERDTADSRGMRETTPRVDGRRAARHVTRYTFIHPASPSWRSYAMRRCLPLLSSALLALACAPSSGEDA